MVETEVEIEIGAAIEAEAETGSAIETEAELNPIIIKRTELERAEKFGDEYDGPAELRFAEIEGDMDGNNKDFRIAGGYTENTLMVFLGRLTREVTEVNAENGDFSFAEAPSQFEIMVALYESRL
jgi:hypothetical protein